MFRDPTFFLALRQQVLPILRTCLTLKVWIAGCIHYSRPFEADQPVTGFWDEFRIEQVGTNLLTNALRYGNSKPVNISLGLLHECVRINVRDDGSGISTSDPQRIVEQFERVAHHDGSGGLGLGLFITKQLVDAHGGSVRVQSQQDKGTIFTVSLPLNAALETTGAPPDLVLPARSANPRAAWPCAAL